MYPIRLGVALGLYPLLGADALWWSFPVGMVAILVLATVHYARGTWRQQSSKAATPTLHECECGARATRDGGGSVVPA